MSKLVYCPDKEENTWHLITEKEYEDYFSNYRHFCSDFYELIYHVHEGFGEEIDRKLTCKLCGEEAPNQIKMMAKLIGLKI